MQNATRSQIITRSYSKSLISSISEKCNSIVMSQNKSNDLIIKLIESKFEDGKVSKVEDPDSFINDILSSDELRAIRFETLELNIQMLSSVSVDLPLLLNADSCKYNNLLSTVLGCIERYYNDLRVSWFTEFMPKTQEEDNIIKLFIQTMQSTEKILKTYISDNKRFHNKRFRNFVIYTGMDSIEPESKYDGITDIWMDTTIHYDPDYVPSEDEDEDDDDDYYEEDL